MILKHLSLSNFRSYLRLDTDIPRRILLLSGGNAQGKTTLLESLFYCASFSSPLSAADRQLIHFNVLEDPGAVARMIVEFEREGASHRMEVRVILENADKGGRTRKEILVDGIKSNAQKAIGTFPCVLFLPQMTRILEGPPDERRRYMNIMLSQSVPGYARALSEHKQIITRRNALLKSLAERRTDPAQLDYWDMMLAQRSAVLIRQRANALLSLKKFAQEIHLQLTGSRELLSLGYLPGFDPLHPGQLLAKPGQDPVDEEAVYSLSDSEITAAYTQYLKEFRENDIRRGSTSAGAHRDDFSIFSSGIDLCPYGSRGQVRTALLSLKLAEIEWMKEHTGTSPLLLLDETLAELDEKRSMDLLERLEQYDQAILTTTDQTHFPASFAEKNTIWQVSGGSISK